MSLFWMLRHVPRLMAGLFCAFICWWAASDFNERSRLVEELAQTRTQLKRAQQELYQAAEAVRIHRAHLARAAQDAQRWALISRELQAMEGHDAILSPFLDDVVGRLYQPDP